MPNARTTGVRRAHLIAVPAQQTSGPGWRWDGYKVIMTATVSGPGLGHQRCAAQREARRGDQEHASPLHDEESWCVTLGSGSTLRDSEVGGGEDGATFQPSMDTCSATRPDRARPKPGPARQHPPHRARDARRRGHGEVSRLLPPRLPDGRPRLGGRPLRRDHVHRWDQRSHPSQQLRVRKHHPSFVQWQDGNVGIGSYRIRHNLFIGVERNGQMSSYGIQFENEGMTASLSSATTGSRATSRPATSWLPGAR